MLIRNLALATGLTPHTIRFYEKEGLLDTRYIARSENNYRHYSDEAVERVETIKLLQTAGFTLSEIRTHLKTWDAGALTTTDQMTILRHKLDEVQRKIGEMEQVKLLITTKLELIQAEADCLLDETMPHQ